MRLSLLRGPSGWTPGERELFGAVVSRGNACPFCVATHSEIARQSTGSAAMETWADGRYGLRVTTTCRFLEKLTATPESVGASDVEACRAAGVSEDALREAVHIGFFFNVINRIANALEFAHPSDQARVRGARMLRKRGYRLPGFLLR
jgi:uncharacterized peroxidase-related enzyme